jgi:hypothetical protein
MAHTTKSELYTYYEGRYDYYVALLALAESYYNDILVNGEGLQSGKFDSGEANTWWQYTDPDKFQKVISRIEAQIDHYRNKLNNTGVVKLNLRRT